MNGKWKKVFDKETLKRGRAYYEDGKVEIVHSYIYGDEREYTAIVTGSQAYTVQVLLDADRLRANCTCPYAKGWNICKHMAAALFQVEEEEKDSEEDNWQEVLETLPTPILKALLVQAAQWDTGLQEQICSYKGIDASDPMVMHRMKIDGIRRQYGDQTMYLQPTYIRSLINYVQEQIQDYLRTGNREVAVELVSLMYKEVFHSGEYVKKSSENSCIHACLQELQLILQDASAVETDMVYEHILALLEKRSERGLESGILLLPWTTDVLTQHLTWLDAHMDKDRLQDRLLIMKFLHQTPNEVVTFLKSREEPYFLEALQKWYEENDPAIAIPIIEEARSKATTKRDLRVYTMRLIDLYQKIGDKESLREELLYIVLELEDTSYLQALKEFLEPEVWRDVCVQLAKKLPFESDKYKILADEKMYDILLMEIMDTEDLELFLRYETALSKQYPEQTYEILVRLLKKEMAEAGTRDAYAWVVKKLKRVKKYPNGKDRLQELVNGFYMQYSNRRAMKEELTKAGYIYNGEA